MKAEITDSKNNLKTKKGREITIPDTEEDRVLDDIVAYEAREELRQTKRLAAEKVRLRLVREVNELKEKPTPARAEIATPVVEEKDDVIAFMRSDEYLHRTPDEQKKFIASVAEYKKLVNPNLNDRLLGIIMEGVRVPSAASSTPTTVISQVREFFSAMKEFEDWRKPSTTYTPPPLTHAPSSSFIDDTDLKQVFKDWLMKKLSGEGTPFSSSQSPPLVAKDFTWDAEHKMFLPHNMTYEEWQAVNDKLYERDKEKKDAEAQRDREKMIMKNLGKPLLDRATPIFNAYARKVEAGIGQAQAQAQAPAPQVRNSSAQPMTRMPAAPAPQGIPAPTPEMQTQAQAQAQTIQEPAPPAAQVVPLNQDGSFNCTNTINGQPCNTNIKVIPDAQGNPPSEITCSKCGFIYRARRA